MKHAVPFALSPAHSVQVPTYHATGQDGQFLAHFPDGTRLPVQLSRQRAYPGLECPAPQTASLYRAASEQLSSEQAIWDVGTGSGYGSCLLAGSGRRVWGFDSDASALEFANHLVPQVRFARLPGEHHHLPEPDSMVLIDVLSVAEEPRGLLWHLRRLAPPGCRLFLAEERIGASTAARPFDHDSLRRLLLLAGWRLQSCERHEDTFVVATAECGDRSLGALYQAAQRALERETFEEARRFLKQLTLPDYERTASTEAWLLLTHLALQLGDLEAMHRAWSSAIETAAQALLSTGSTTEVPTPSEGVRQQEVVRAWHLASALQPADPLTRTRLFTSFAQPQHRGAAEVAWQAIRARHPVGLGPRRAIGEEPPAQRCPRPVR